MSHLKIECARRQLGTALDLYLRDLDPISVHCLASGGWEVIAVYAEKAGAQSLGSEILKLQPNLTEENLRALQRDKQPNLTEENLRALQRDNWNAFKHAMTRDGKEREDNARISAFTDQDNDLALYIGWADYNRATKTMPIEAQIHQIWWRRLHAEKLDPERAGQLTGDTLLDFSGVGQKPRAEQKRMLNKTIEWARAREDLMNDPKTDRRPLVLAGEMAVAGVL